jgi:hypothetical protein
VKRLFNDTLKERIDRFVSIDGEGLGVTHIAIGSTRGSASPSRARSATASDRSASVQPDSRARQGNRAHRRPVSAQARRARRSTSAVLAAARPINAIASEAWMEVDLRSGDTARPGRSRSSSARRGRTR